MKLVRTALSRGRSRASRSLPLPAHLDAAEGADLLGELPGSPGVLLWGALRDFMLWVETPAGARASLFAPGAGELRRRELAAFAPEQELWAPLLTLAQMADAPEGADAARLVYAVRTIARWAERAGAPATRLAFTRAAALALPQEAAMALETGRLARDVAHHAQAETWFRRAIRLARGRDWESYAWGFIGLGVLYMRAGNYPAAGVVVSRALRVARKRRLAPIEGSAHHHLFVFCVDAGRMEEAYGHARAALAKYGGGHPRLSALAHDVGCFWAEQGRFSRALSIFEAALPWFQDPVNRVLALANYTRAAAGVGDRARYASARAEVAGLLELAVCGEVAAESLLLVAQGDTSVGEWGDAEEAARRALEIAATRGEARTQMGAEAQLQAARNGRAFEGVAKLAETPRLAREAEALAGELRASLARPALAGLSA
jgi:tetratricopeptide (TPR) repeat protein